LVYTNDSDLLMKSTSRKHADHVILVAFDPGKEERDLLSALLGTEARVVFLPDLSEENRLEYLREADVLISWFPAQELRNDAEFRAIESAGMMQLISAGADQIPFSRLPPALIVASNVGAYAQPMAEHAVAMILALEKNLLDRHNKLKAGNFDQHNVNRMLRGSTCAILGFGGIGKATARLLRCFDVTILAINTTGKTAERVEFIGTLSDLEHVLRAANIVVIALPLNNSTTGLLGSRELGWMKEDAILVNVSRGAIIQERALFEHLKTHPKFSAALDAWWREPHTTGDFHTNYPFFELPNFLGSPHNSAIVPGSLHNATMRAAENVKRFLNGDAIIGKVN
jgi:phosphoglycerate dehydrogenase-like enzyme